MNVLSPPSIEIPEVEPATPLQETGPSLEELARRRRAREEQRRGRQSLVIPSNPGTNTNGASGTGLSI